MRAMPSHALPDVRPCWLGAEILQIQPKFQNRSRRFEIDGKIWKIVYLESNEHILVGL